MTRTRPRSLLGGTPNRSDGGATSVFLLVFVSGFASLVYEVLWMRQAAVLLGSTSQAAAVTFAAFFAGLAAGSWFWGRRVARFARPLALYAGLELGIAVTALLFFAVLHLFQAIYPWICPETAAPAWLFLAKIALALLLVFPPAFCMGGTIPVVGQHLIRQPAAFGATSALLYGINTAGAAAGAYLAGFHLPLWLGYSGTCVATIALTLAVAAVAAVIASRSADPGPGEFVSDSAAPAAAVPAPHRSRSRRRVAARSPEPAAPTAAILPLAFLSGFGLLALEVVWTRVFAQVLENSAYTFSAILVVVLACLAAGAIIAARLIRLAASPAVLLAGLAIAGGLAVAITPLTIMAVTDSLRIVVSRGTWPAYVAVVFRTVALGIGLPATLLATLFPLLMKLEERRAVSAGRSLGTLAAANTAGAIVGSIAAGFVLLEALGMWRSMQWLAVAYAVAALLLPLGRGATATGARLAAAAVAGLALTALDPARLPTTSVDPLRGPEQVLETWEGSDCTVAAVAGADGVSIKVNSHYGLGSTGAAPLERLQAAVPLMAYPATKSVFFLGLGTGITAGAALDPQFPAVRRVVACELVPEVITAARKYIAGPSPDDPTTGLFRDPRATVLAEDGRHYLMAARGDRFDMINADLFVPFRSGAGSLYSLEHFRCARERLAPGGVFVQWLPLYQVTEREFGTIARTMIEAFGSVSLWRNTFQPGEEVVALVGHAGDAPLPACADDSLAARRDAVAGRDEGDLERLLLPFDPATIPFFYCGNLSAAADRFAAFPLNTDDHPVIEYLAPRTFREPTDLGTPWFVGPRLAALVDELQRRCPPDTDPLLTARSAADRRLPVAGAAFHRARLWQIAGDAARCRAAWDEFVAAWTDAPR